MKFTAVILLSEQKYRKENIMSKNYTKIKNYYESGLWSIDRVWNVVGKKLGITEEEYKKITGFTYPDKEA